MAQLRPRVGEIRELGAELVAVGNGSVTHLRWFLEDQKPDFPVFTDPSRRVYELAELHRGVAATFAPGAALRLVGALARGHRQAGVKGDALQQGGVLIVLPGGTIAWRHASRHSADHPSPEAVVAALRKALAAEAPARKTRPKGRRRR